MEVCHNVQRSSPLDPRDRVPCVSRCRFFSPLHRCPYHRPKGLPPRETGADHAGIPPLTIIHCAFSRQRHPICGLPFLPPHRGPQSTPIRPANWLGLMPAHSTREPDDDPTGSSEPPASHSNRGRRTLGECPLQRLSVTPSYRPPAGIPPHPTHEALRRPMVIRH